jgi:hypothetical protein
MHPIHRSTVVGVFPDRRDAEHAVNELRALGVRDEQIGVAVRDGGTLAGPTAEGTQWEAGAATGAVAGGATGTLLGIAVAAGLIPGVGQAVAGGILGGLLASAATGAVTGGILGALIGLGVPEEEAAYYSGEFQAGRVIVTVQAGDLANEVRATLRRYGAYDVDTPPAERPIVSVHSAGGIEAAALPPAAAGKDLASERGDVGASHPRSDAARRLNEGVEGVSSPNMPPGV